MCCNPLSTLCYGFDAATLILKQSVCCCARVQLPLLRQRLRDAIHPVFLSQKQDAVVEPDRAVSETDPVVGSADPVGSPVRKLARKHSDVSVDSSGFPRCFADLQTPSPSFSQVAPTVFLSATLDEGQHAKPKLAQQSRSSSSGNAPWVKFLRQSGKPCQEKTRSRVLVVPAPPLGLFSSSSASPAKVVTAEQSALQAALECSPVPARRVDKMQVMANAQDSDPTSVCKRPAAKQPAFCPVSGDTPAAHLYSLDKIQQLKVEAAKHAGTLGRLKLTLGSQQTYIVAPSQKPACVVSVSKKSCEHHQAVVCCVLEAILSKKLDKSQAVALKSTMVSRFRDTKHEDHV